MWIETLGTTRSRGQVKDDIEPSPRTFSSKMGLLAQIVGIIFVRKTSKASHSAFLNFPLCLLSGSGITCEKKYICQDIVSSCCTVISLVFFLEEIYYWLSILADVLLRTITKIQNS